MSALIEGACDPYPILKFDAIELGTSWVPGWMHFMKDMKDYKKHLRGQVILHGDNFVLRLMHVNNTPWIIENSGEDMLLFSSGFQFVKGCRNPLRRFNKSLEGISENTLQKIYVVTK